MGSDTRSVGRSVLLGVLLGLGIVAVVWLVGGWQATIAMVAIGVVLGLAIGLVQRFLDRKG